MAPDTPEHIWFERALYSARDANRLPRWMPALTALAPLCFAVLCTAMIVATRVCKTVSLIAGLVVGIPLTAAVLITIGYAIGQSRTVHRWVGSPTRPTHATVASPPRLTNEADTTAGQLSSPRLRRQTGPPARPRVT